MRNVVIAYLSAILYIGIGHNSFDYVLYYYTNKARSKSKHTVKLNVQAYGIKNS